MNPFFHSLCLLFAICISNVCSAQIPGARSIIVPRYPELGIRAHKQGLVVLDIQVENGEIVKVDINDSTTVNALAPYTKRIVELWKFRNETSKKFSLSFEYRLLKYEPYKELVEQEIDDQGKFLIVARMNPPDNPNLHSKGK
jgi:hypothetical protein